MPFFDGIVGRVYYRHWAAAVPAAHVVFLHGYGEHSGMYHRFGDFLGRHGIEVWAPDAIGHGLSAGQRGDPGSVEALRANAERMSGVALEARPDLPIVLVGSSMGAITAASLATARGETFSGVVLAGPPLDGVTPCMERAIGESVWSLDPFYMDELENDPLKADPAIAFTVLLRVLAPGVCRPIADGLSGLAIPSLFLCGEIDAFCASDAMEHWAHSVPGVRTRVFAGGHHDILNDTMHDDVAGLIAATVTGWAAG
jgi:alpha-beta hydrolase superfamily lysophospholipase